MARWFPRVEDHDLPGAAWASASAVLSAGYSSWQPTTLYWEQYAKPPSCHVLPSIMLSFVNGMSEFLEGEVSLVCRKIILIHGRNPGFYYLDLKRFK